MVLLYQFFINLPLFLRAEASNFKKKHFLRVYRYWRLSLMLAKRLCFGCIWELKFSSINWQKSKIKNCMITIIRAFLIKMFRYYGRDTCLAKDLLNIMITYNYKQIRKFQFADIYENNLVVINSMVFPSMFHLH